MTAETPIATATATVAVRMAVDVGQLYLHPLNTRSEPPPLDIEALADSILSCGLLQNLLCYVDAGRGDGSAGRLGVVAGGRRLRALQQLAAQGNWTDPVHVQMTTDPLQAEAWANVENEARHDPHPADQIRAYGRMAATGALPATIARAFAVTEGHVRRRLRLAHLPDRALDALKAGTITLDQCAALTVGEDEARREELIDELIAHPGVHANWIKRQLAQTELRATDRRARFVGLDLYEASGGRITRDLFSDDTWLHDEGLLDRLFARQLAEEAERLRAEGGWGFVLTTPGGSIHDLKAMADHVQVEPEGIDLPEGDMAELEELSETDPEDLTEDQADRLAELEARQRGAFSDDDRAALGLAVWADWSGKLRTLEGLRKRAPKAAPDDDEADDATGSGPAPAPEPDISQALREDFLTIRRAAIQTALLLKPELVLDMVAFALDWSERHANHGIAGIKADAQNVTPSIAEGLAIVGALTGAEREDWRTATSADFAAFRDREGAKKARNEVLTRHFARAFMAIPGDLTDLVERLTGASVRAIWQPDARNCFGRMRSAALVEIYREVIQPEEEDERFAAFLQMRLKDQVREIDGLFNDHSVREAYGLDRDAGARIDAWVPAQMRGAA